MSRMNASSSAGEGAENARDAQAIDRMSTALVAQFTREMAEPLAGGLYVVATPIGNLGDMTVRGLGTLARADAILCEDTRVSRTLLGRYGIERPLRAFHEHNEDAEQTRVLAALAEGRAIALISDAGTPLLSDPGFKLVRAAVAAGHAVTALPGPSAILAGLTVSGLPTDGFFFGGFLPPRTAARCARLEELGHIPGSLVLFESPARVVATLTDIAATLGARDVVMARELTKRFEEVRRGRADELAKALAGVSLKGEIVLMVGPPMARQVADEDIEAALRRALETLSLRDAVRLVMEDLGAPRSRVYPLGLKLRDGA